MQGKGMTLLYKCECFDLPSTPPISRTPHCAIPNMIEPNNTLGLYINTPSPITSNVESLDEAESDKTPLELSPLSMVGIQLLHPSVPGPLESPDVLCVTFGGKVGSQVRWEKIMPSVDQFIKRCAWDTAHSLTVVLEPSNTA